MCVWVVAWFPQRLKSMLFKNFLHSRCLLWGPSTRKNFKKRWFQVFEANSAALSCQNGLFSAFQFIVRLHALNIVITTYIIFHVFSLIFKQHENSSLYCTNCNFSIWCGKTRARSLVFYHIRWRSTLKFWLDKLICVFFSLISLITFFIANKIFLSQCRK